MTEDEVPTSELIEFYAEQHAKHKTLKGELANLEVILEGLEEILVERIPEGIDSMAHTCPTGTKVSIKAKSTERFQPARGQSDAFWAWVQAEGQWSMTSRTVLQAGVQQYLAANGELPPSIERVVTTKPAVSVITGAPRA